MFVRVLVFDDFPCRQRDEKFAVFDTLQTQNRIGKRSDLTDFAAQNNDFHTIVVTDVDVQNRHDEIEIFVLERVHLIR